MRRVLSVLLENESGALSRVVGLFSQRGYNIESLTVAPTDDPTLSRMTIQTVGDQKVLEQIEKQLHKLVDVLRVSELGQGAFVEREIMLVKIQDIRNSPNATSIKLKPNRFSCYVNKEIYKLMLLIFILSLMRRQVFLSLCVDSLGVYSPPQRHR